MDTDGAHTHGAEGGEWRNHKRAGIAPLTRT